MSSSREQRKLDVKPEDLLYAETHEWVHITTREPGAIATVGISAFAVQQLTDLVYMELPAVGKSLTAGEPFGEVESVKAVSDLYSPVTGEVVEVHQQLAESLQLLTSDPFGAGWMIKVKITDPASLDLLLDHATYQRQCAEQH